MRVISLQGKVLGKTYIMPLEKNCANTLDNGILSILTYIQMVNPTTMSMFLWLKMMPMCRM
jgi:hypothetical protein